VDDWWNQTTESMTPVMDPAGPKADAVGPGRSRCPWCSAEADPCDGCCPSCGAVMAQRESIGGMVIPGVTDVDPGLRTPSVAASMLGSQARMSVLGAVGQAGGPSAQIVTAAAMLARDSFAGAFGRATNPDEVGRPSQAALQMAGRLNDPASRRDDARDDGRSIEAATPDEQA